MAGRRAAGTLAGMSGSAAMQADLWGERAGDWAELLEQAERPWLGPAYRLVLDRLVTSGTELLDVGCGSGRFCVLAGERGAAVAGIDATPGLLAIARERNPDADLRRGDLQFLPWTDRSFDVVTGFNAFFYAADIVAAFREARRVLRPGGHVALTAFGRPERCESAPVLEFLAPLLPSHAVEDETPIESLLGEAGFTTVEAGYLEIAEEYEDLETLLRAWLSIGPVRLAVRNAGETAVREALGAGFAPLRTSSGGYRVEDEYRYVIAQAATG
jgi:ubiquinone/menaquinone biosynthesis C-methylase UbiE